MSDLCEDKTKIPERGQAAAAEAICQQRHALVADDAAADVELLQHRQRAAGRQGARVPSVLKWARVGGLPMSAPKNSFLADRSCA